MTGVETSAGPDGNLARGARTKVKERQEGGTNQERTCDSPSERFLPGDKMAAFNRRLVSKTREGQGGGAKRLCPVKKGQQEHSLGPVDGEGMPEHVC